MAKIKYIDRKFNANTQAIIQQADTIIEQYQAEGLDITLRQLYYRFIAMDLFPDNWIDPVYNKKQGLSPDTKNTDKNYKNLGSIINDARLAGLIDWEAVVDRTRYVRKLPHWSSPDQIIKDAASQYRIDKWEGQRVRCEVFIEKDALIGVIEQPCNNEDVHYLSCRGYISQSEMWSSAQRLLKWINEGYEVIVFHVGDHDPSGIDMSRDIQDRLDLLTFNAGIKVNRIALTMDQINEKSPPPNPAKITDSRAADYIKKYGRDSWELDALEPAELRDLISNAIYSIRDEDLWLTKVKEEKAARDALIIVAENCGKKPKKK